MHMPNPHYIDYMPPESSTERGILMMLPLMLRSWANVIGDTAFSDREVGVEMCHVADLIEAVTTPMVTIKPDVSDKFWSEWNA